MAVSFGTIPKAVRKDSSGVLRVADTRVSLDSVVYAFNEGMDAAGIQYNFDTLSLAEVHAAIAYYLHNRPAVDAYLEHRRIEWDQQRREHEAKFPPPVTREMLLARKNGEDPNWKPSNS
jgi:uncharacterized protein (DUF433 family)